MIALGLLLLLVAAVVALVGIFSNLGSSHQLGRSIDLLGYHLHGSTGKLLLVGVIIGAVGMLGLNMLLAGIGRGFKRTITRRQERRLERRQATTVAQDRDHLAAELEREQAARVEAERQRTVPPADPAGFAGRPLAAQESDGGLVRKDRSDSTSGLQRPDPRARRGL